VGFSDKLRLMAVLMDDLKTIKELPIRGCRCGGGGLLVICGLLRCSRSAVVC